MFRRVARRAVLSRVAAALVALPALASAPRLVAAKSTAGKSTAAKAKAAKSAPAKATGAKAKAAKSTSRKAFRLVTGCGTHGGCSCSACKKHAANKFFASRADVVRAHQGCNCQVDTMSLPNNIWIALFGLPERPTTTAVDKRDPRVGEILSHLPKQHTHHHK
jgi:hypothetical protein